MDIVVVANDITPEFGEAVAAPGLRAWSMGEGLRAHGHRVQVVVNDRPVRLLHADDVPATTPRGSGVLQLSMSRLDDYVTTHRPDAVVFTNSNHVAQLGDHPDVRVVFDFFAPKMLEAGFGERSPDFSLSHLERLREQKIAALQRADIVAVNGHKKLGYVLAWLLQTQRDPHDVTVVDLPFGIPAREPEVSEGPLKVAVAGYVQRWSGAGDWLDQMLRALDEHDFELHLVLASHWGGGGTGGLLESYKRLLEHPRARRHEPMTFGRFREFIGSMDVTVDLFERNVEREFAMVTRTLVALCSGSAVIHPGYTEVAPLVEQYEAGWLLRDDGEYLHDLLARLVEEPDEVQRRRWNAIKLAREVLEPSVATADLNAALRAL